MEVSWFPCRSSLSFLFLQRFHYTVINDHTIGQPWLTQSPGPFPSLEAGGGTGSYNPLIPGLFFWPLVPILELGGECVSKIQFISLARGFPGGLPSKGLMIKNLPANAGDIRDMGSIPGLGRCPGVGQRNTIQYSCLENLHVRRSLVGVHNVTQSRTWLKWQHS